MAYPIPPWLTQQGADPAGAFVSAFRAGASVAIEKAQLAQQSELAAMRSAIMQKENEQQARRADQKIAIEAAQTNAELGLRQQALDIAQQKAVQTAKTAALSFQAQETYRRRVAGGEDPQKVLLELGPIMGVTTGLASLAKAPTELMKPGAAQPVENLPGYVRVQKGPQSYQYIPQPPDKTTAQAPVEIPGTGKQWVQNPSGRSYALVSTQKSPQLVALEKALAEARVDLALRKDDKRLKEEVSSLEGEISKLKGTAAPAPFAEGTIIRNKKDGKRYKVVNGVPQPIE